MGRFSAELTAIMSTREISLAEVIRDTGVSRTAFFKYKSGGRLPSDIKTVERLADVLYLNYDEKKQFMEAYLIDQIGEYKYRGMMAVEKLLTTPESFLRARKEEMPLSEGSPDETRRILNGKLSVTMKIISIIGEGLQKGDVTVFETISSDDMFRIIRQVKRRHHEHELFHIMAMNGSGNASVADRLHNVERLGSIIRTLCSCDGYRPFYYYASLSTLRTLGILQTNMILTEDGVLCYAEDYSSAAIYREPEIIAMHKNIVAEIRGMASPYAEKMNIMDGYRYEKILYEYLGERYIFFPGLCISSIMRKTDDLLEKHVRHDLDGINTFLTGLEKHLESVQTHLALSNGKHRYIISGPGLRFNYANGVINDFPKEAIIPLNRAESEKMVRRFRKASSVFDFRVLDADRFPAENTFWVDAIPGQALINILLPGELAMHVIVIREQSTAALIFDYLSSLYETRALTGAEREAWYDKVLAEGTSKNRM